MGGFCTNLALIWAIYARIAKKMSDSSKLILSPYLAPLYGEPHLLPQFNVDETPLLPHLRGRALKYRLIGASVKFSSISSFSYSCPNYTVRKSESTWICMGFSYLQYKYFRQIFMY